MPQTQASLPATPATGQLERPSAARLEAVVMACGLFRSTSLLAVLGALGVLVASCKSEPPPRSIQLEVTEPVLSRDPVAVLVHTRDSSGRRSTSRGAHDFSVSPAGVANITDKGFLTCAKSGDATVSVAISGVSAKTTVRCRLIEAVKAKDVGRVDISDGPFDPELRVVDKAGSTLRDVPLELTSLTPKVVKPENGKLVPVDVGRATIIARSGQASTEFTVDVVRRLKPEALPINNDKSIHFSLDPGKYELVVNLAEEKKLGAEWRGAPYCNYSGTAKLHKSTCVLRTKGGVVFDNPAWLLDEETTVSHDGIELREVP